MDQYTRRRFVRNGTPTAATMRPPPDPRPEPPPVIDQEPGPRQRTPGERDAIDAARLKLLAVYRFADPAGFLRLLADGMERHKDLMQIADDLAFRYVVRESCILQRADRLVRLLEEAGGFPCIDLMPRKFSFPDRTD